MLSKITFIFLISSVFSANWVVLIAGSNTWSHYRHQADVYHMYQIAKKFGVPENRLIVFAFNDLAQNSQNPFRGQIFNSPDGPDVYKDIKIDYHANDVTISNFIACLTGDKDMIQITDERTTGKVLESNSNDNVFIYFDGLGERGKINFPVFEYLEDIDLFNILRQMHEKKMFKEMVFYLDSPDALHMFEAYSSSLRKMHIYTLSGSQFDEIGYIRVCECEHAGEKMGECLGNEFSLAFMEDIEKRGDKLKEETIEQQFEYLDSVVKFCRVHPYGDDEIAKKRSLWDFISG